MRAGAGWRVVEERAVTGVLGLRVARYLAERGGVTPADAPAIDHLDVSCVETGARASRHPRTGLHGFLVLPRDRALTLRIVDPTRAHVPRTCSVSVPSPAADEAQRPAFVEVRVREGIEARRRPGATVVWGFFGEQDATPCAFARVEVSLWVESPVGSAPPDRRFVTTTDARGAYCAAFDGLGPTADDLADADGGDLPRAEARVVVHRLRAPAPDDPLAAFPPDFDALEPPPPGTSADDPFTRRYEPHFDSGPRRAALGAATRIDATNES